jgi:K+-sensing histidine kinase KdpD
MSNYLNKIKQNSYRQQRLIANLLDVTKINAGHMLIYNNTINIVSFTKEIVESVKLFALLKKIKLKLRKS